MDTISELAPLPKRHRFSRCLAGMCYLYPVVVVSLWILLRWADLWWPATFLMFSPRLLFGLPLVVLVPAVFLLRRRWLLLPLVLAGLVVAGPLSGGRVPFRLLRNEPAEERRLRIMTCNMHYRPGDLQRLEALVSQTNPDVVALQEWGVEDPSLAPTGRPWHVHHVSGLFLASRYPILRAQRLGPHAGHEHGSVARYELDTPAGIVTLFSLHLDSPRQAIYETVHKGEEGATKVEGNMGMRWRQSRFIAGEVAKVQGSAVLVGDFNTPPESAIFRRVWHDLRDAFGEAGWGWGYTFYGAKTSVRIDHILASSGWHCQHCWIGPSLGSPHLPVLADLVWQDPAIAFSAVNYREGEKTPRFTSRWRSRRMECPSLTLPARRVPFASVP